MKLPHSLALAALPLLSGWAVGADLAVKFDLPVLNVAEYHKPYVAIWIEQGDATVASSLAVLYDVRKKDNAGLKWVKDLRQWWRKAGRDVALPADGLSGATRGSGEQTLQFGPARTQFDRLPAGDYKLVIEATREAGGRELVRIPFSLPVKAAHSASASGKEELGAVSLKLTP